MKHQWERFDTFFSRCSVCGWGWKFNVDNEFPCPGPDYLAKKEPR